MTPDSRPPVALIAGPTASGKSALGLALAEHMESRGGGTIINADASQVYTDLRILSARPDEAEMARAPHRLFGHVDGAVAYSAAAWADEAKAEIGAAHEASRLPILVGGTGLYIRTLLNGIAPIPEIDPEIRAAVRALPVGAAHARLRKEDPVAAARLATTDSTRVARALEVIRSTGTPIGEWQARTEGGIGDGVRIMPMILLPPREWLRERCDARFLTMLEAGAESEVEALANRELAPDLPVMRAIGVRDIMAYQAGEIHRYIMIEQAQAATRQYAKRQQTWFANQPPADWPRFHEALDNKNIDDLVIKFQL